MASIFPCKAALFCTGTFPHLQAASGAAPVLMLKRDQVAYLERFMRNRIYLYDAALQKDAHCPIGHRGELIHLSYSLPLGPFLLDLKRKLLNQQIPVRGVYLKGGAANLVISGEMLKLSDLDLTVDIDRPRGMADLNFWNLVESAFLETLESYSEIRCQSTPTQHPSTVCRSYYDRQNQFLGTETVPLTHPPHLFTRLFGSRLKRTMVADEKNQYALHTLNTKIGGRDQPIDIQFVERSEHNCLTSADSLYIRLDEILQDPREENIAIKIVDRYDERALALREKHQFIVHREGISTFRRGLQGFCRTLCRGYYPLWGDLEPRFWDTFISEVRAGGIHKFSEELHDYLNKHYPDDPQGRLIYLLNFLAIIDRRADLGEDHPDRRLRPQIQNICLQLLCLNLGGNSADYTEGDLSEFLQIAYIYLFLLSRRSIQLEGDCERSELLFFSVQRPGAEIYGNNYLFIPNPKDAIRSLRNPSESVLDHSLIKALARVFPHGEDNLSVFFAKYGAPEHPGKMDRSTLLAELAETLPISFLIQCMQSRKAMKHLESELSPLSGALMRAAQAAIDTNEMTHLEELLKTGLAIPQLITERNFRSLFAQLGNHPLGVKLLLPLYEAYARINGSNIYFLNEMVGLVERDGMESAHLFEFLSESWQKDEANRSFYEDFLIRTFEKHPRFLPRFFQRNPSYSLLMRSLEAQVIMRESALRSFLSDFTIAQIQRCLKGEQLGEAADLFHRAVRVQDLISPSDSQGLTKRFAAAIRSNAKMAPPIFARAPVGFIRKVLLNHFDRFPYGLFNSLTAEQKIGFFVDSQEDDKRIDLQVIERWIQNAKVSDVHLVHQMLQSTMVEIKDRDNFLGAYFLFMNVLYPDQIKPNQPAFRKMISFLGEGKAPLEMCRLLAQYPEGLGDFRSSFLEIAARHPEAAKIRIREAPPSTKGKPKTASESSFLQLADKKKGFLENLNHLIENVKKSDYIELDLLYRIIEQFEIGMKNDFLSISDSKRFVEVGSMCIGTNGGIKPLKRLSKLLRLQPLILEWVNFEFTFLMGVGESKAPFNDHWPDAKERIDWIFDEISSLLVGCRKYIHNPDYSVNFMHYLFNPLAELAAIDHSARFKQRLAEKIREIFDNTDPKLYRGHFLEMGGLCGIYHDFRPVVALFRAKNPSWSRDFGPLMEDSETKMEVIMKPLIEAFSLAKDPAEWAKAFKLSEELEIRVDSIANIFYKKEDFEILGLLYYNLKKYKEAVATFQKALAKTGNVHLHQHIGNCYAALGEAKNAIDSFSTCAYELIRDRETNQRLKSFVKLMKNLGPAKAIQHINASKSAFESSGQANIYFYLLGKAYGELAEVSVVHQDRIRAYDLAKKYFAASIAC